MIGFGHNDPVFFTSNRPNEQGLGLIDVVRFGSVHFGVRFGSVHFWVHFGFTLEFTLGSMTSLHFTTFTKNFFHTSHTKCVDDIRGMGGTG